MGGGNRAGGEGRHGIGARARERGGGGAASDRERAPEVQHENESACERARRAQVRVQSDKSARDLRNEASSCVRDQDGVVVYVELDGFCSSVKALQLPLLSHAHAIH